MSGIEKKKKRWGETRRSGSSEKRAVKGSKGWRCNMVQRDEVRFQPSTEEELQPWTYPDRRDSARTRLWKEGRQRQIQPESDWTMFWRCEPQTLGAQWLFPLFSFYFQSIFSPQSYIWGWGDRLWRFGNGMKTRNRVILLLNSFFNGIFIGQRSNKYMCI